MPRVPKITLIDDWRRLALRLWSIRLSLLAALLGSLELVVPHLEAFVPARTFAVLSILAALAAAGARLIPQKAPEK